MAKDIKRIAEGLGAIGAPMAETGGGAFGMARLTAALAARLQPSVFSLLDGLTASIV